MSSFPNQSIQLYVARLGNNPERYTCETDYVEVRTATMATTRGAT